MFTSTDVPYFIWSYYFSLWSFDLEQATVFVILTLGKFHPKTLFRFSAESVIFQFPVHARDSHTSKTHLLQPPPILAWCCFARFVSGWLIHSFHKYEVLLICKKPWWATRGPRDEWGSAPPMWPCKGTRSQGKTSQTLWRTELRATGTNCLRRRLGRGSLLLLT